MEGKRGRVSGRASWGHDWNLIWSISIINQKYMSLEICIFDVFCNENQLPISHAIKMIYHISSYNSTVLKPSWNPPSLPSAMTSSSEHRSNGNVLFVRAHQKMLWITGKYAQEKTIKPVLITMCFRWIFYEKLKK